MDGPDSQIDSLPRPDRRNDRYILIFDGQCGFCRSQVARLARWDRRQILTFLPLQDPLVTEWFPELSHERLMKEMILATPDGRLHGGAAAFKVLTRKLPRLWLVAPLFHIPWTMPIWQWAYQLVARNRYRLWARKHECETGTCSLGHEVKP